MSFRKRNEKAGVSARTAPVLENSFSQARNDAIAGIQLPPSLRKSPLFSHTTVHSTGTPTLDDILGHKGQPLGTLIIIMEDGVTDFASVVARCYAAQGSENRDKVVAVGVDQNWKSGLPARRKRSELSKNSTTNFSVLEQEKIKIAWRYNQSRTSSHAVVDDSGYCAHWSLAARPLSTPEITVISVIWDNGQLLFEEIISEISNILTTSSGIVRVVIPGFLSLPLYPSEHSYNPKLLLPFLFRLRTLVRTYPDRITILITMTSTLFHEPTDRQTPGNLAVLLPWIEQLADGVLQLVPCRLSEDDHESSFQGLVEIMKLPLVSERGSMAVRKAKYAFKVGKSGMKIEKWGTPLIIGGQEKTELSEKIGLRF
ncbi:Elongator complex protein 4 [Lipomyces oligophaga]|uniref:Elongator complex protein 4 n=1 Tax=Lipomyces oligophaga TaxID=45792 RepID=UPI0034CD49DD